MNGKISLDLEMSDEEFLQHKREAHKRYEQWFLDLCQGIWDRFFAGKPTAKFNCPHCGEGWALFPREDGWYICHRCLTKFATKRGADDGP